jgi:RimJ/RimL family protein N-acetyltransferase
MIIPRLETERLRLREFRESDIDAMATIFADEDVPRFITPNGQPQGREFAWRVMTNLTGHWTLRGFGMWALEEKATGRLVGYAGPNFPETWPGQEIGWTVGRDFWGKGYASEAARKALIYARDTLKWPRVIHVIDPANLRSIAVAERLGSKREGEWAWNGKPIHVYGQDLK